MAAVTTRRAAGSVVAGRPSKTFISSATISAFSAIDTDSYIQCYFFRPGILPIVLVHVTNYTGSGDDGCYKISRRGEDVKIDKMAQATKTAMTTKPLADVPVYIYILTLQ